MTDRPFTDASVEACLPQAFVFRRVLFYTLLCFLFVAILATSDPSKFPLRPSDLPPNTTSPETSAAYGEQSEAATNDTRRGQSKGRSGAQPRDRRGNAHIHRVGSGGGGASGHGCAKGPLYTPPAVVSLPFWFWAAHVLYFELEIDRFKYRRFTQAMHGTSAGGAVASAVLFVSVLLTDHSCAEHPGVVQRYANSGGLSIGEAWVLAAIVHFLPLPLHALDLWMSFPQIAAHHGYYAHGEKPNGSMAAVPPRLALLLLRPLWFFVAPLVLTGLYMSVRAAMDLEEQEVYGVELSHWEVLGVVACSCAATTVLVFTSFQVNHSFKLGKKYTYTEIDPAITQGLIDHAYGQQPTGHHITSAPVHTRRLVNVVPHQSK